MKISIEQIDELRNRVNVTYDEAKKTLEKNEGDLVKSIIELEKKKGIKNVKGSSKDKESFSEFLDKILMYKLSVKNSSGNILLNVPLLMVALVTLLAFWVVVFCLVIIIFNSCKIKVYKSSSYSSVNDLKQNFKYTVDKVKTSAEKIFEEEKEVNFNKNTETDDEEVIIE